MPRGNPRSSGYERNDNDWYIEPTSAVFALLYKEEFTGGIHDPSCGSGNIPICCNAYGYNATGADIVDRGYGEVQDFLLDIGRYDNIISNPPFDIATEFTLRALDSLTCDSGKVCILQRLAWLEGRRRYDILFGPGHLHKLYTFSNRISMPPGGKDIPAKGGSIAFAWFVFGREGRPSYEGSWVTAE